MALEDFTCSITGASGAETGYFRCMQRGEQSSTLNRWTNKVYRSFGSQLKTFYSEQTFLQKNIHYTFWQLHLKMGHTSINDRLLLDLVKEIGLSFFIASLAVKFINFIISLLVLFRKVINEDDRYS